MGPWVGANFIKTRDVKGQKDSGEEETSATQQKKKKINNEIQKEGGTKIGVGNRKKNSG